MGFWSGQSKGSKKGNTWGREEGLLSAAVSAYGSFAH